MKALIPPCVNAGAQLALSVAGSARGEAFDLVEYPRHHLRRGLTRRRPSAEIARALTRAATSGADYCRFGLDARLKRKLSYSKGRTTFTYENADCQICGKGARPP